MSDLSTPEENAPAEVAQASSILALYDHTMITKHNRALLRSGASSVSC